jgi:probable F420-dependent oxidoreductase
MNIMVGVMYANGGQFSEPALATALATSAEAVGYDSLWAIQHIVVPTTSDSTYPYAKSGKMPGGDFVPVPDPLVWLAFVAGATTQIRLATGVLVLPQQHPLVVAKQVATLDRLSGGRMILGVGAGWMREEFEAVGATFENRGRRLDEAIQVLRGAWSDHVAVSKGPDYPHGPVAVEPKPVNGMVPIVVGGNGAAAVRRAGRLGDGYFPVAVQGEELRRLVQAVRIQAEEAGRDPRSIEITVEAPRNSADAEFVLELEVDRMVVRAPHTEAPLIPERLAERMAELSKLLPVAPLLPSRS